MLALDHRGSIGKLLEKALGVTPSKEDIIDLKRRIVGCLYDGFSGVLLDPDYGIPAYSSYLSSSQITSPKPFLLCIEKTGYLDTDTERLTELEYTVSELKNMGAKGIKILLFFHPEAKNAPDQLEIARKVYTGCQKEGLPFFFEILNYPLHGKPYDPSVLVPASVKFFLDNGIKADVFKLEFPGTGESCRKVTGMLGDIPWILLTKGADYEKFKEGLKIAAAGGASGFLAGRSVWQDVCLLPKDKWDGFFNTVVNARFKEISEIILSV